MSTSDAAVPATDDPLDPRPPAVQVAELERWGPDRLDKKYKGTKFQRADDKFPIKPKLNNKLVLWKGDITQLAVDAIVNPTNESMTLAQGVSGDILERGGPALREEMDALEGCRTGCAKMTGGHGLPAAHVIHTVGPRYNAKYQTAAENALHNCYRGCMQLLVEGKLRTIALSVVNSQRKGYPPLTGAHIAIRTVRRFMEKWHEQLDCVIFAMPEGCVDYGVYRKLLPLYFPRLPEELEVARKELPEDTGNEVGETVIEERKIRIQVFPGSEDPEAARQRAESLKRQKAEARAVRGAHIATAEEVAREREELDRVHALPDDELRPGALARMTANPDERRGRANSAAAAAAGNGYGDASLAAENARREADYQRLADVALSEDLSDIARLNYIYQSGNDADGDPIVVMLARNLDQRTVSLQRALLYCVRVLHPLTSRRFSIIYFNTGAASKALPPASWFNRLYGVLEYKFAANIKNHDLVHPSFYMKMSYAMTMPFSYGALWAQTHWVESMRGLLLKYDRKALNLPDFVYKQDEAWFGTKWIAEDGTPIGPSR